MKPNSKNLKLIIFTIFLFYGCGINAKIPLETKPPSEKPSSFLKSEGKYYYFTEAQIQKKQGNYAEAVEYIKKAIAKDPESLYLHRELAVLYLHLSAYQKALQVSEQILQKHPDDVDSLIMYGRINHGLKQLEEAKKTYEKVIELDPRRQNIYLMLGSLYMDENDNLKALKVYKKLVENFPDSYVGFFFIGKIYGKEKKYQQAEEAYKKAIELEPKLEEARFELIKLYIKNKSPGKAETLYKEILKTDPNNIKANMGLGLNYVKNGKPEKAENLFKQLAAKNLQGSVRSIIQQYLLPEKFDDAKVIIQGMLKSAPGNSDLNYLAGVTFDGLKEYDRAIMYFKKVTPNSKFYENSATHVFFLYQRQGKVDEAIAALNELIKNIPDNPDFFLYLGTVYEDAEEYEKAIDAFKKGLEVDPENTKLLFRSGVVYDKWGQRKKSLEVMRSLIDIDPEHAEALNYIGYTYADSGENLDEAEKLILKAMKYKPGDGYIIDSLGWVY